MEKFIGTKIIEAEPAYRVDGKTVQPTTWPVPEGAKAEEGYAVRYPDGYMSWSPKDVFEEAYRRTDNLAWPSRQPRRESGLPGRAGTGKVSMWSWQRPSATKAPPARW